MVAESVMGGRICWVLASVVTVALEPTDVLVDRYVRSAGDRAMTAEYPADPVDTRDTFERIAEDFDRTRDRPWPAVESFTIAADTGGVALDLGCGNGRHLGLLARRAETVVGIDVSRAMLLTAVRNRPSDDVEFIEASALRLPLHAASVDIALYVAAMHHLPSVSARIVSLDELARVMRPGRSSLVSVWSVTDDRFDSSVGFDTTVDWTLPGGETVPRFYHIYDRTEFDAELDASKFDVVRCWEEAGNLYAHLRAPTGLSQG